VRRGERIWGAQENKEWGVSVSLRKVEWDKGNEG